MRCTLVVMCLFGALGLASSAHAQEETPVTEPGVTVSGGIHGSHGLMDSSDTHKGHMISVFAFPNWVGAFGAGVAGRYGITLLDQGFIGKLNDSVELEAGADAWYAFGYYLAVAPVVEGRWTFHILPKLSAYAKVGIGAWFPIGYNLAGYFPLYYQAGVGGMYQLSDSLCVRAEATSGHLMIGLGMSI